MQMKEDNYKITLPNHMIIWWDKTASARSYRSSNKESIVPTWSWSIQST